MTVQATHANLLGLLAQVIPDCLEIRMALPPNARPQAPSRLWAENNGGGEGCSQRHPLHTTKEASQPETAWWWWMPVFEDDRMKAEFAARDSDNGRDAHEQ